MDVECELPAWLFEDGAALCLAKIPAKVADVLSVVLCEVRAMFVFQPSCDAVETLHGDESMVAMRFVLALR